MEETGWCKLDPLFTYKNQYSGYKEDLLRNYGAQNIILYAPTFSPSLTSAPALLQNWRKVLECNRDCLLIIKFHDLMDRGWKQKYRNSLSQFPNAVFIDEPDILKYLVVSDLMVSDTSSVVYEFLLLNKPVITFKSRSEKILWDDFEEKEKLTEKITETLLHDPYQRERQEVIKAYHPYDDGKSSFRMIDAVNNYINNNGIPKGRKLNLYRRLKIRKFFGIKP